MEIINLAGEWDFLSESCNKKFILPGTASENKIGVKKEYFDNLNEETVRTVLERYEYLGKMTLVKEVEITEAQTKMAARLFLERVNIASSLYVDGVKIGRQILGLSTPHIYDLTGKLTAGKHEFKILLDNTNIPQLSNMASGYSRDTQGYWIGVVGRIEIQFKDLNCIENVDVYPAIDDRNAKIQLELHTANQNPIEYIKGTVRFTVTDPNGELLPVEEHDLKLYSTRQNSYFTYHFPKNHELKLWDEFSPEQYTLKVELTADGKLSDIKIRKFGMREIKVVDKEFTLNNKPIALRGSVNCAQFPLTGYPPTDYENWIKQLQIFKEYGLNHVRFHAWCPPEAAFEACDDLGIYALVEMPLWLNMDVTKSEVNDDPIHEIFFTSELKKILFNYGNHPSFMFLSNGNENMGDFAMLDNLNKIAKALDNRHLYTMTSNFDHPVTENEDYFSAFQADGRRIRINTIHDRVAEDTRVNFQDAVDNMPVPIVNFEVGQYCVYPDIDSVDDFTGCMLPANFEVIKKQAIKNNIASRKDEYIKASGDLAARLYKEDIEAVMRTKKMGGFQLLSLVDYTGQTTATVGMFDIFLRDKNVVDKEFWRGFCGPVVPLFKAKRIFSNREKLEAELDLYDYGRNRIQNPEFEIKLVTKGKEIYCGKTKNNKFSFDLSQVKVPAEIEVKVTVDGHTNSWKVYVFEDLVDSREVRYFSTVENRLESSYVPVFWSPVLFPTNQPCGAIIDEKHEALKEFPTGKYPNYQWKTLLDNAIAVEKTSLKAEVKTIIELVPNFKNNNQGLVLYESDDKLYCGFDLTREDLTTRCLKKSLFDYCETNKMELVQMV